MNLTWKTREVKYGQNPDDLYVGPYRVASVGWRIMSRDEENPYSCNVFLPGLREHQGNFVTVDEAKERAEQAILFWFNRIEEVD